LITNEVAREFMIKKLIPPIILALIITLIVLCFPPKNIPVILLLISLFFYLLAALLFGKKTGLLAAIYCLSLLSINYLIGFSYLNLGLLTSLLIATMLLIK